MRDKKQLCTFEVLYGSETGTGHLDDNKDNEDAVRVFQTPGVLITAIADGAGSASHAAIGSAFAVRMATLAAWERFKSLPPSSEAEWHRFISSVFFAVRFELINTASVTFMRDYASTLLLAVIANGKAAVGHVGDGLIVAKQAGELKTISQGERGEFYGFTYFITSSQWYEHLKTCVLETSDLQALVLMTDGLEPVAYNERDGQPVASFFERAIRFARRRNPHPEAKAARVALDLQKPWVNQHTNDDKTIAVIYRVGDEPSH